MLNKLAKLLSCDINESNFPVRAEQIRARMKSFYLMIFGQALIALLLVSILWEKVPHSVLLTWLGVLYFELSVEVFYNWREGAATRTMAECLVWRKRLILVVIMAGSIWGAGGVLLFVADDLAYQALLICVFLGVAAGAATTNPVFPPSLYIYISLLILPLLLVNALVGDRTHWILAVMLAVYWAFVLNAGRELARIFELSLRRTFENEQLVSQLREKKQLAEQGSLLKSRFLAAASHDLRQPIHALNLFLAALKNHVQGKQGEEVYGKVVSSVEAFNSLLDALLDISKLDAGVIVPNWQLFSIQPLLGRLYDEFVILAHEKGLRLEMSSYSGKVYSDPVLLERVLRNLISNAIHYTEQGRVSLLVESGEAGLKLTLSDTGVGIAPDHLAHIFEEYYQAGSQHSNRHKGLGLGLAIVKRLDMLLFLQLDVSSVPGEGSCFSMLIPMREFKELVEVPDLQKSQEIALPW